ncbi:MAG: hypothetical protein U0Q16_06850 [Bryobacteraceae bacterium]
MNLALLTLTVLPVMASEIISGPAWKASFSPGTHIALPGMEMRLDGSRRVEPARTQGHVRYRGVYNGIHLDFYRSGNDLEYDFIVEPGADPASIAMTFHAAANIEPNGDLTIGSITQKAPVTYQWRNGRREIVPSAYTNLDGGRIGFAIGAYDHSLPLVIDPVITLSKLGGTAEREQNISSTRDSAGNFYLIPQGRRIRKINSTGTEIFVREFPNDFGAGLAGVDGQFNIYLATGGFSQCPSGSETIGTTGMVFTVKKLSPDGLTTLYQKCIKSGGSSTNTTAAAVDAAGNFVVTGFTNSSAFPATGNFGDLIGGQTHLFVMKFDPSGNVVYSVVNGNEAVPFAVALDSAGFAYVGGQTGSQTQPRQALQTQFGGGTADAYVLKVTPTGDNIPFATFLGGSGTEAVIAIGVDAGGNIVVAGFTDSTNFPSAGASARPNAGNTDAFVARLVPSGATYGFSYSTQLGGSGFDRVTGISVRSTGEAVIAGTTSSANFPVVNPTRPTVGTTFAANLASDGELLFSTYAEQSGIGNPDPYFTPSGFALVGQTSDANFFRTAGSPSLTGGADWYLQIYTNAADLDLRLSKTVTSATATVRNFGPETATSVRLTFGGLFMTTSDHRCVVTSVSAITCTIGTMQAGASTTVRVNGTVLGAGVTSSTFDPNQNNNTDQ